MRTARDIVSPNDAHQMCDLFAKFVQSVRKMRAENERLRKAIDNLQVQATCLVPGWVGIPTVEWESIMASVKASKEAQ